MNTSCISILYNTFKGDRFITGKCIHCGDSYMWRCTSACVCVGTAGGSGEPPGGTAGRGVSAVKGWPWEPKRKPLQIVWGRRRWGRRMCSREPRAQWVGIRSERWRPWITGPMTSCAMESFDKGAHDLSCVLTMLAATWKVGPQEKRVETGRASHCSHPKRGIDGRTPRVMMRARCWQPLGIFRIGSDMEHGKADTKGRGVNSNDRLSATAMRDYSSLELRWKEGVWK